MRLKLALACAVAMAVGYVALPAGADGNPSRVDTAALATTLRPAERLNPPSPPPPPAAPSVTAAQQILAAVNAERAARGLAPMVLDGRLQSAAQGHSDDQAARQTMSHTGGDGSDLRTRMNRSGFPWSSAGENVAYGYPTVGGVMTGWMNSSGHRANILGSFTHLGVGLAYASNGVPYWTQVFATAR